jgi:adenylosuccinate synthase
MDDLSAQGILIENFYLSGDAPVILPEHQRIDVVFEEARSEKIGTTKRGIGPAYEDVTGRRAVFIGDLLDRERLMAKLVPLNRFYNQLLTLHGGEPIEIGSYIEDYLHAGERLKSFICDTVPLLHQYCERGEKILFEGAQGVLLDLRFGTYPFVTSSVPTVGGLFAGTGLSHKQLGRVVGVTKAYTTRVGGGPFPSELSGPQSEELRSLGNEYGATTGRPRRVGWLDLVALKYAVDINGVDELFLTKIDVLGTFATLPLLTDYRYPDGQSNRLFCADARRLAQVEGVYHEMPGWGCALDTVRKAADLPAEVRDYIGFIESYVGVPVRTLSVGPTREQTIRMA